MPLRDRFTETKPLSEAFALEHAVVDMPTAFRFTLGTVEELGYSEQFTRPAQRADGIS